MPLTVFFNTMLKSNEHYSRPFAQQVLERVEGKFPQVQFRFIDALHSLCALDHSRVRKKMKETGLVPDESSEIEAWHVNQVQREAHPSQAVFFDFRNVDLRFADETVFKDWKLFGVTESLKKKMDDNKIVVSQALDDEAFAAPQKIKWFPAASFKPERANWHDHYAVFTPFASHKTKELTLDATKNYFEDEKIDENALVEHAAQAVERVVALKLRDLEHARFKYLH